MMGQEQKAALHSIWRDLAEKSIVHGVNWPRIVRDLFEDLDNARDEAVARVEASLRDADPAILYLPEIRRALNAGRGQ